MQFYSSFPLTSLLLSHTNANIWNNLNLFSSLNFISVPVPSGGNFALICFSCSHISIQGYQFMNSQLQGLLFRVGMEIQAAPVSPASSTGKASLLWQGTRMPSVNNDRQLPGSSQPSLNYPPHTDGNFSLWKMPEVQFHRELGAKASVCLQTWAEAHRLNGFLD